MSNRTPIPNDDLTLELIPDDKASDGDIAIFSDSFDGYGHWNTKYMTPTGEELCTMAGNVLRYEYEKANMLPDSVVLLRTALFVEYKCFVDQLSGFDTEALARCGDEPNSYVKALLSLLREKVFKGDHLSGWSSTSKIVNLRDYRHHFRHMFAESGMWASSNDPNSPDYVKPDWDEEITEEQKTVTAMFLPGRRSGKKQR